MSFLELRGVEKHFGTLKAIKGIDLSVEKGEFVVFVGPSGCGKSTLLRMIAGLTEIDRGVLFLDGRDITRLASSKRDLAMVFQSYALYPHMSVADNMSFALRLANVDKTTIREKVRRAAEILNLTQYLERTPKELSGGQRQRVAIGRAIVRAPKVFLYDEPLSNLDAALRGQTRVEIAKLHRELGATTIYVTHDQVEAMTLADRVVVLRDGSIEQVGSPLELYRNPDNLFVAGFLGAPRMNFFLITVDDVKGQIATVSAPGLAPIAVELAAGTTVQKGAALTLGVRPESVAVCDTASKAATISGQVRLVEHLGRETILYVDAGPLQCVSSESGTGNITVQVGHIAGVPADAAISLSVNPHDIYLFSQGDERTITVRKPILDK
jgi:multiple sugar transport system ATP-binding protein